LTAPGGGFKPPEGDRGSGAINGGLQPSQGRRGSGQTGRDTAAAYPVPADLFEPAGAGTTLGCGEHG
jgi:hypothetical protein